MAELRFDDRVAVVTGAGRGLGREYALLLAANGGKVIVNDADAGPAEQVTDEIRAAGGEAIVVYELSHLKSVFYTLKETANVL